MSHPLTLEERQELAELRITRFVSRFEPGYLELVCHAALPLVLTPELLSYLRNEFLRHLPWVAEVDLLLSDLCSPIGHERYAMDPDVRDYAISQETPSFTPDRKRQVAKLLITYIRYLAGHRSYHSDRELATQQWAAMLYLGVSERQQVVDQITDGFRGVETAGAMVGADLLDRAELARLAQITQTFQTQLADYPGLLDYARLVNEVQMGSHSIPRERVERSYIATPGKALRLPSSLTTELLARGRLERDRGLGVSEGITVGIPEATAPNPSSRSQTGTPEEPPVQNFTSDAPPDLQTLVFQTARLIESEPADPDPTPATPELEPFSFTIATLQRQRSPGQKQSQSWWGRLRQSAQPTPDWVIQRQPGQAYRYVETLPDQSSLELVAIPGGSFMMGSPEDELEHQNDESPQREVTLAPFLMGRYPITQAQWRAVASLPQVERELNPDPSKFKGDSRPVEQVNWFEAMEFCARLSAHTHRTYTLPSEAQWEYACRAGTTSPFHFGETITPELANYDGNYTYADGPKGEYRQQTTPVDQFGVANAWGLAEMHGNVWEWCLDHYHDSYAGAPRDGSAWVDAEAEEDKNRIRRGGSWVVNPWSCRCAYRFNCYPDFRFDFNGFRVVSVPPRALG
jgi:formylglycine-generating enzyme required for sulfatase activity